MSRSRFEILPLALSLILLILLIPGSFVHSSPLGERSDTFLISERHFIEDEISFDSPTAYDDQSELAEDKVGLGKFFFDSLVIYVGSWPLVLALDTNTRKCILDSSFSQWIDNISQAPVWDDGSSWVTNNVGHPFLGATYFLYYRSQGHSFFASSVGTVLQTILFEYTIEGFCVTPSLQDLVKTPALGIPLGYAMDELSLYFLRKKERPIRYLGYFFNPFNLLPWSKDRWHVVVDPLEKRFAFTMKF